MRSIVVSPTYNEAENIEALSRQLAALPTPPDLLVVDDGSADGTEACVRRDPRFGRNVFLLQRGAKQGLGTAYVDGMRWALEHGYEAVVQMDADLSHNPGDVPRLLAALADGAELALGSRYCGGVRVVNWELRRLLMSVFAGGYVRLFTGLPVSDPTGGFRAWRATALRRLPWGAFRSEGYVFLVEMLFSAWRKGQRVQEIPIIFTERRRGESKISRRIVFESAARVPLLRFRRSLRAGVAE